jgi:hypothetical protein
MLQSPAFTYHWEMASEKPLVEGKLVRLGAFEMASQLSYTIYGSMPDQALFDAAAGNKLGTQAEVEAQARRMLADPKAREGIAAFVVEWLSLDRVGEKDKEKAAYPEYNDGLVDAMGAEAQAFVKNIAFEGDAKFESLLTAKFTFANQALAGLYGIKGAQGAEMKQSALDPAQRSGLLTQAAFLSLNAKPEGSSPVKRGKAVYTGLLCGELPPPPNVVPPVKPASAGGTTRDRFTEHDTNPCAKACHKLMDPIGFGFERYDGIGRYRTTDNNLPVDSKSSIELDGATKTFDDAIGLTELLAGSASVRNCFVTQWFRFAVKRENTDEDQASVATAAKPFAQNHSIRDLIVAVAGTRSFRYRMPAPGEMLQ